MLHAICNYVMLVTIFAYTYIAAAKFDGEILRKTEETTIDGTICTEIKPIEHLRDYLYFSTTTASSLAHGDLIPMKISRFFVMLEISAFWIFVVLRSIALREQ